jgi:hypothetical protein
MIRTEEGNNRILANNTVDVQLKHLFISYTKNSKYL